MTVAEAALALTVSSAALFVKAEPTATPHLAISIQRGSEHGQLRATVENLAAVPVAFATIPSFALTPSPAAGRGRPSFRAPVDLGTAKPLRANERMMLRLAARQRQTIVVALETVYWDHARSALWPSRPLRRVVLPGEYDLTLEIEDPVSGEAWQSSRVPAVVTKSGTLEIGGDATRR